MKYSALAVSLMGLYSGCFGEDGNGKRVTQTRRIPEAIQVINDSPFEVDISQGERFEVRVSIDSNLQRFVETSVRGDTLRIEHDDWIYDMVSGPHVLITMPKVESIENRGSGDVFASWFEQEEEVLLHLGGSGNLSFEGSVSRVTADLRGSGDLHLSGETDFADLAVHGSGDVDANDLRAGEAVVISEGSGDVRLTVDGRVDASLDGSGDVELSGDVERGRFEESGSGEIRVR
jgi:hypothetical protein